jgi:hypothetical protein
VAALKEVVGDANAVGAVAVGHPIELVLVLELHK